jgi:putative ABC transport system ATP-binding protein
MIEAGGASAQVEVRNLAKKYYRGGIEIDVLKDLDLDVAQGRFVAFMGPSGSGKTTLLNLIGGLDTPTTGTIRIAGEEISSLSGRKLAAWRARHIGFIFQMYNLIPVLTAFENVQLPLLLTGLSRGERRTHVEEALALVGLSDRARHYPRQLSGGQEQRVAIARAIVTDPSILLCDEPTGDLDRVASAEILDLIGSLSRDYGKTVFLVTHDPVAAQRADTIFHLEKGTLLEQARGASPGPGAKA